MPVDTGSSCAIVITSRLNALQGAPLSLAKCFNASPVRHKFPPVESPSRRNRLFG
jgi:hypothetical protein